MTDELEERAIALIKSKPRGILQSELWKDLGIDSRKCSRVVAKLEAEGKVKRTWETVSGTRTYRLSYVEQKKEVPKKEYRFDLIMAEDEVAPCVGCTYECEPDYCPDLGNWIELLAREAMRKPPKAEPEKIAAKEAVPAREAAPVPEVPAEAPAEAPKPKAARARKARAAPEPVVEEAPPAKPVKAARKGKAVEAPAEEPVKPAKAAKRGKKAPEPEEEEEPEEVKPAKRARAAKESKPAPKAPEIKETRRPSTKKR